MSGFDGFELTNLLQSWLLAAGEKTFWLPEQGSSVAAEVDKLFYIIAAISVFFFGAITALMILFVIKYRRKPGEAPNPQESPDHNMPLEVTWTIIPLLLVMVIFWYGFKGYVRLETPPEGAYEVKVHAKQWSWTFDYVSSSGNSAQIKDLHVPPNQPVLLTMDSTDVLHSVYIPAFRVKKDIIPGRITQLWFQATKPGTYPLYCAEFCGKDHSFMLAKVIVHQNYAAFQKKVDEEGVVIVDPEGGRKIFEGVGGCLSCHSTDGSPKIGGGPSFKDLYGKNENVSLPDGTKATVVVDQKYLYESIEDPNVKVVEGYSPIMPKIKLSERQINALIAYIMSFSEKGKQDLPAFIEKHKLKKVPDDNEAEKTEPTPEPQAEPAKE